MHYNGLINGKAGESMARSSFQKLKILYVMDYLLKNSDEGHPVSVAKLIEHLSAIYPKF